MSRIPRALTALSLAVGATAFVTSGGPTQAAGVATYDHVAAQVFGDVAVGMPNQRTVKIQHRDPATGQWDAPTQLYKTRGRVTCGDIDGQSSPGGTALLVECDTPYYEDQAPVDSVALVSQDGFTWAHHRLDGEAYLQPAIAPGGQYAAWLVGGDGVYVEWSATTGFAAAAATTYESDTGGETLLVDDAGTVSVLGTEFRDGRCVVGVHTRDLAGQRTHSVVPGVADPGCTEGSFENLDALTVTGGGQGAAHRYTLSRADTASPWALTRGAPADAPGLVTYEGSRKRIITTFLETSDPADPIVAIGSPDRHRVLAQTFDAASQTWAPQTELHVSARRCSDGGGSGFEPRALYVFELRCRARTTVLASSDGVAWTVGKVGGRPWIYVDDLLALPDATGTTVLSPTGQQRYAATAAGRCDVVYPGAPGVLVRLHGKRGWPTKVQVSTGGAFRTVSTAPRPPDRCKRAFVDNFWAEPVIYLQGVERERYARFAQRRGVWRVSYPSNPFE